MPNKPALVATIPDGWLSQDETCRILQKEPRRLNEMIRKGEGPQKVLVKQRGTRPAPFYHPGDVERLRAAQEPKAAVFSLESGVEPRAGALTRPGGDLVALLDRVADRAFGLLERRPLQPPVDLGPWLSIAAAAAEYGLPVATLAYVAQLRYDLQDPAVYRASRGGLRIRRGAVAAIDAGELHAADAIRPRRPHAKKALSADEAAGKAARPIRAATEAGAAQS